jgi:cell wall-associated NlpC family hydrolase
MTAAELIALDVDLLDVEPDDPDAIAPDEGESPQLGVRTALTATASRASVSGLSDEHRTAARHAAVAAAVLALRQRDRVHYTQGPARWDGIANHRFARRGDFPRYADCSAFVTWCTYQGVRFYQLRDVVNGADWKAGYTGTMLSHGKAVQHAENYAYADAVLYGRPGTTGAHTALYVGGGMVISHGSEGGPYLLPIDYRPDRLAVHRYI